MKWCSGEKSGPAGHRLGFICSQYSPIVGLKENVDTRCAWLSLHKISDILIVVHVQSDSIYTVYGNLPFHL